MATDHPLRPCTVAIPLLLMAVAGCAQQLPHRLVISPVAKDNLNFLYNNLRVEFAFCAYGEQTRQLVWVRRVELPKIIKATTATVEYGYCHGRDFLGYGHSHPEPAVCGLSNIDVRTFLSDKDKHTFLVCPGNFLSYNRKEVEASLQGIVVMAKAKPINTTAARR
ncbi:MAG: hypothetical protein A3J09_01875 [Candidatus Zambryskibacteria bacterium RIFCSPLOWO2_02_FULL_51_21]|uniref:JAB domain-containing protein n=1 Tax=Candidatus Zambryskibacteria bacterium RIFCSPHIGHO2_02_FULL_43_37 TaxID=1802749 RepID=A0A1G2TGM6_9BACT|nr:MAG: hypothetical protein A2723_01875 [Candidatus Zambryskibacteria bacterium RIFCSPHIGHO2_01_FULL_52_18]OHA96455.1 MAG: hypothetical protein A3D49_01025 [Candidatus Zambryskibacteria bacterium RIFCSPHIGHO2_02_FULL_43_37]OHB11284.1 MAG: hypothetical protein A3J09_01875 [Candidatus Zambryskibacteria bacterium RIFCSPLOWO2_02_FULL_51_21]